MLSKLYACSSLLLVLLGAAPLPGVEASAQAAAPAQVRKLEDIIIYKDDRFYSTFPSIVRRPNGELLVAFRRAPDRRRLGQQGYTHTDPNSYLELVRSHDGGKTWSTQPELLFAHPFGGSQDPCMVQLRDGTIVCTSYGWASLSEDYLARMTNTPRAGRFGCLGGYLLRSSDSGHSWQGPFTPCHVPTEPAVDIFGQPLPAANRGALCEGRDGRLYWVVAAASTIRPRETGTHLLISEDRGMTWHYACPVATDPAVEFNETSLYETPKGDLVAFMRTERFNDHTAVARSTDHGRSFGPWADAGFMGHPHYALRLPDQRVLLVYGYRHAPFGVRARVLDSECAHLDAPELVLRDDGGNGDLGYPWATLLDRKHALVVYYFNQGDGTRFIAGTVLGLGGQ